MTDYSTPEPLTKLTLRKFEHFRITTHDAPPVPLHSQKIQGVDDDNDEITRSGTANTDNENSKTGNTNIIIPCRVCNEHISRYTCPRCSIPYCSVACYQSHAVRESNISCTEEFYQERVQSIVKLEQKAKQHDTRALLNRTFLQQQHEQNQSVLDPPAINNSGDEADDMAEEDNMIQLLELLSALEQQEQQGRRNITNPQQYIPKQQQREEKEVHKLLAKSPKLRAEFLAAVERGEVLPLVLKQWNPWWRPNLSIKDNDKVDSGSSIVQSDDEHGKMHIQTLDERILRVKSFQSLMGPNNAKFPDLTYNLLGVLYCIIWTLRLYHGAENVTNDPDTALEAAFFLLQNSSVLGKDARFENLHGVLSCVTEATADATKTDATTPSWTTMGDDLAFLVSNPRYMARALLEALDIFKAAGGYLKKNSQSALSSANPELADLRRKRKKLEFFFSWLQDPRARTLMPTTSLSTDIRTWVERWKLAPSSRDDQQGPSLDALLTMAKQAQPISSESPLLMQERTSSRKMAVQQERESISRVDT